MRSESTFFDQVYSGPRRRPAMISLNVQWIPTEHSGTYQWSGDGTNSQKVKTVTYFGTGEMRGQQQASAITPPGSDYTDAYLSAFASKPIPTRHVNRLSTDVLANSVPIPLKPTSTPLSTNSSIKTSETRFININNIQPSTSFNQSVPFSSNRSTTYSTNFIPEKTTTYEPFSSTQYSSPQSQTFTSNYSTSLRSPASTITSPPSPNNDNQRSYTTFQNVSQPISSTYPSVYRTQPSSSTFPTTYQSQPSSSSTFPTVYRSQTSYESIYKPLPAYSIESYPPSNTYTTSLSSSSTTTESTYKPSVPFQTAPLSSTYNINQSSNISERIAQPIPQVEKQIERPETLLFQHDEDMQSAKIEKPLPIITPSPDSPIIREEYKVEAERSHGEDSSVTSEPIRILENTLSKYDSLINQISEVLASVSPLSSTVSSMSPGTSVLDQISSDSSPILQRRQVESQSSQQAATSSSTQHTKPGHLIREDSYDKIVTAISDLDTGMISPSDMQNSTTTITEEKEESSTPLLDEMSASLTTEEEKVKSNIPIEAETKQEKEEEIKDSSSEKSQTSPVSEEQPKEEAQTPSTVEKITDEQQPSSIVKEEKSEESKVVSTDEKETLSTVNQEKEEELETSFIDHPQIPSITDEEKKDESTTSTSTVEKKKEETQVLSADDQETTSIAEKITDEQQPPSTVEEEKSEETKAVSIDEKEEELKTSFIDHPQIPLISDEEKKEETQVPSTDDQQTTSIAEKITDEQQPPLTVEKEKSEETKVVSTDEKEEELKTSFIDHPQIPSITDEEKKEETQVPSADDQQTTPIAEKITDEQQPSSIVEEQKSEETKAVSIDEKEEELKTSSVEHPSIPSISDEEKKEEIQTPLADEQQLKVSSEEEKVETETTLPEEHQISSVTDEETKTDSSDERQISPTIKEEQEETKTTLPDEEQVLSIASTSDVPANEISPTTESKSDEEKTVDKEPTVESTSETAEFIQEQTGLLTNVPNDTPITEEPAQTPVDVTSAKKTEKHVTWDETVVDNEDDDSSSHQSLVEENSTSEASIATTSEDTSTTTTTEKSETAVDQQVTSSENTELQTTSDQSITSPTAGEPSIALSSSNDQQVPALDSDLQTTSSEQQPNATAYLEDQTKLEATTSEQQTISSDSIEPHSESSTPLETSSAISGSNESKEHASTVDETSTATSDVVSQENINKTEELPESKQEVQNIPDESETTADESTTSSLQTTIVSPIDTVPDTIANRFISSDVYHGYLGDHKQFLQDVSDVDDDNTKKSLLASLRETITAPIVPLIESIQGVVSNTQATTPTHSLQTESEITDHSQDETKLTTTSLEESNDKVSDDKSQLEENKSTEDTSEESKSVFESIREAVTAPITTITETIQTAVSNLQSNKEEVPSTTSSTEHVTTTSEKPDESTETHTKTTLEVIRDAITHPLTTITEKIQSAISTSSSEHTDQASAGTLEQTESSEKQTSLDIADSKTVEQEPISTTETEHPESTEHKTTLETLRDVITHPIDTITEKIQSIISSSSTEEVSSSEQQTTTTSVDQNKTEDITSTTTAKSTFETPPDTITDSSTVVNETVQDVVSNTTDQTSSSQEKEQILGTQQSEFDSQDQIQGEQESSSPTISSEVVDHETTIQRTESASEHSTDVQNEIISDTNQAIINTVRDLINDTINNVIHDLNQNVTANEEDVVDNQGSISDMTWANLVGETSSEEKHDQSPEEIKQLLTQAVQSSNNITVEITEDKTTITLPNETEILPIIENISQQTITTPQIDDNLQRSSTELESDSASAVTEIEKVPSKPATDLRESSPTNTEDDSLELIHALQGHSIIHPSSPIAQPPILTPTNEKPDEQILHGREKSSSSTTSSQITSSDRYVSYAIHEMGDSSQDRLPAFPVAADIPIYKSVKTTSDENKDQQVLSEPIVNINPNPAKDDDLTELDATENLTSYSDDNLLQKLNASAPNRQDNLDASSTDDDADDENFNELDQVDVPNLHRIVGEITQQNQGSTEGYEQAYQRYDLSNSSSTSTKAQTDDIYIIPGYPGLWRPSVDDDESTNSALTNDADDEDENKHSTDKVKTRTIVRTTDPTKLQSFLQQHQGSPIRPDSIDIFNRPLNEFSFDVSESDSFKTCASTINSSTVSKHQKQSELFEIPSSQEQQQEEEHQISPDEKIILIRERERGVSLPVTMKIDCDDMALRLSTSTPIDAPLYSTTQTDLPSPSTHSEPLQKTTSSSRASTPSAGSNESEQQKLPSSSWLNTVNTITTTIQGPDGPLEARTTIHKSSKGPISIAECDAQGKFIIIENTSRSKSIALSNWTLRQESENENTLTFKFPDNCLLRPNQSLKILTKSNESERRNGDLIASLLSSWHTGSNVVTTLINADGKDRASLTKKTLFS